MYIKSIKQHSGSALIVALSILLVLTILGVSAMRNISLEEKMAGNMRDYQVAFEAAETAIREGELYLTSANFNQQDFKEGGAADFTFPEKKSGEDPAWLDEANWAYARTLNTSTTVSFTNTDVSRAPLVMIQDLTESETSKSPDAAYHYDKRTFGQIHIYQVTARGFGVSPNSRVMLQTNYGIIE